MYFYCFMNIILLVCLVLIQFVITVDQKKLTPPSLRLSIYPLCPSCAIKHVYKTRL